jgi:hypothetical protein
MAALASLCSLATHISTIKFKQPPLWAQGVSLASFFEIHITLYTQNLNIESFLKQYSFIMFSSTNSYQILPTSQTSTNFILSLKRHKNTLPPGKNTNGIKRNKQKDKTNTKVNQNETKKHTQKTWSQFCAGQRLVGMGHALGCSW